MMAEQRVAIGEKFHDDWIRGEDVFALYSGKPSV